MNNLRTVFTSVLTAVLLCVTATGIHAQAVITKKVPATSSFSSDLSAPNGTTYHTRMRAQLLLQASEISLPLNTIIRSIGIWFDGGANTAASGNFRIWLQNSTNTVNAKSTTWATALTGMNSVYNGSLTIPTGVTDAAEASVNLATPFTYTGGSLYVSFEYEGLSFATISARAGTNADQLNGFRFASSNTTTAPAILNNTSDYRPQIVIGYDNPNGNDLSVSQLVLTHTYGQFWGPQNPVTAVVKNLGNQAMNNVQVKMNVAGANTASITETVTSIAAGDSALVEFQAPMEHNGTQTITVTVPDDGNNNNNSISTTQKLDCSSINYASDVWGYDSTGFGTASGISSVKYTAPQIPVRIDAVNFRVTRGSEVAGNTVTAVILDDYGNIVANSDPFVLTAAMLGTDQTINLQAPAFFNPGENFYAGILQEASAIGYYPVGRSWMRIDGRSNSYTFAPEGGSPTPANNDLTYMIGVQSNAYLEFSSSVYGQIQDGTQAMFVASPGYTNYNFKVNGVSKYSGPDNFYIYFPSNGDVVTLETTINACTIAATDVYNIEVLPITPGTGNILYVNRHAAGFGDGSSWASPLADLSDALRWAKVREANFTIANPLKIFVAGGTYKPIYSAVDENFGMDGGPNNAFLMVKNVQLFGGFAGTETSPEERDLSKPENKTILSGDYSDDDQVSGDGSSLSMTNFFENAFHVVMAVGEVENAVLDGFTITGGGGEMFGNLYELVNSNQIMVQYGGGLYIHASSPQLRNLVIAGNKADMFGGGVFFAHSSAALSNSVLYKNYAGNSGGAIYNDINSEVFHTNLTITNNRAFSFGGAMANSAAIVNLRNSILYGNSSGIDNHNSTLNVNYSLVQGMPADAGKHNLAGTVDPIFTDAANDDYSLKSVSSLINKGNNLYFQAGQTPDLTAITKDLRSKTRIGENVIDLGAYEAKPTLDILQHPASITSCQGTEVNFVTLVNFSGSTNPTYQWQQSTDGTNWTDIDKATEFTYLIKANSNMNFRCIVSIPGFSVTTNAAALTTIPFEKPVINLPDRVCLSVNNVDLKATPAGGVFSGDGVSENTWSLLGFKTGKQTISYTYTSPNGCVGNTEKVVTLESCTSDGAIKLFQSSPNPAKSIITVRIDMGQEIRESELIIAGLNGQWVIRKPVTLFRGVNQHEFDVSGLGAGMYFISIYSHFKKPLATIRMVKQ